jgi:hypothetical protein
MQKANCGGFDGAAKKRLAGYRRFELRIGKAAVGVPPAGGPNAVAALAEATFWIERVRGEYGNPDFNQLQYTQRVLLNFNRLSWPHITVATLREG